MKKSKKTVFLISIIICLAFMIGSCGGSTENVTDTTASDSVISSKENISTSGSSVTTADETTTQTATSPTLPDIRVKTPVKGLYELTEEKGSIYAPDFCTYGDLLIYRYEKKVKLIDITNGNILTSSEEDEEYLRLGLTDNGYYFVKGNTVELFDIKGKKISDTILPADELWTVYVSPDMKYILYSAKDGTYILDLSEGKDAKADIELYVSVVGGYSGERFILTDYNSDMYYLYIDGRTEKLARRKSSCFIDGVLFETNFEGIAFSKAGSLSAKILYGEFEDKYVSAADERFFMAYGAENRYRIYDTEKNRSTDGIDLETISDIKACGNGAFVILEYYEENRYEFYVLFSSESEFPVEYESREEYEFPENYVQIFKEPEGDEETLELIEYIYDKYHVRVFFELKENQNGQLFEYYFKDFTGDKKKILNDLVDFMKLSPDDIWRQVRDGNECYIYFCDAINEGPDAAVDAVGLTLEIGENPAIALQDEGNITIDLFSHEFIHLLEKNVYYELLNDWDTLSPDGSYFMSYENYYTRKDAYDYTCLGNKGKVYFIDNYSRTFPTEDRARVGEYLYTSYKEGKLVWQFKDYKYVRRKAVKLCEILRQTYPCLSTIPKGEWYLEKYL